MSLTKCLHASDRGGSNRERERERGRKLQREGKRGKKDRETWEKETA